MHIHEMEGILEAIRKATKADIDKENTGWIIDIIMKMLLMTKYASIYKDAVRYVVM